jgi:hypothetical protein
MKNMKNIFRILAFFIRILFFYSEKFKSMIDFLLFPKLIDSQITLKEDEFLYSYLNKPYFENSNYFTVKIINI